MLSVVVAMGCALVAHAQSADEAQAYTITRSKVVTLTSEA